MRYLNGGCSSPVAAYGKMQGENLLLTGLYYVEETGSYAIGKKAGVMTKAEELGIALAKAMQMKYGKPRMKSEE